MVYTKYECEHCGRTFHSLDESLEHEKRHKHYLGSNKLKIAHQPPEGQWILKLFITNEFYENITKKWLNSKKEFPFEEFILHEFEEIFQN